LSSSRATAPRYTPWSISATGAFPRRWPPWCAAMPLLSANPVVGLMAPERPTTSRRSGPATRWPAWCTWAKAAISGRCCRPWPQPGMGGPGGRRFSRCGHARAASRQTRCLRSCVGPVGAGDLCRGPHRLGAYRSADGLPEGSARRRLAASDLHLPRDRARLVRRRPHRRRQPGPHRGAVAPIGDGASEKVTPGSPDKASCLRCFRHGKNRDHRWRSIGEALLSGLLRAGRQLKDLVVLSGCPTAPHTWPIPIRCW